MSAEIGTPPPPPPPKIQEMQKLHANFIFSLLMARLQMFPNSVTRPGFYKMFASAGCLGEDIVLCPNFLTLSPVGPNSFLKGLPMFN